MLDNLLPPVLYAAGCGSCLAAMMRDCLRLPHLCEFDINAVAELHAAERIPGGGIIGTSVFTQARSTVLSVAFSQ